MYKSYKKNKKNYNKLTLSQSNNRHNRLSHKWSVIEKDQKKGSENQNFANTMKKYHEYCYSNQKRNSRFMSKKGKQKLWQTLARKNNL